MMILKRLTARLAQENLNLKVTESAKDYIAVNGSDSVYGARPLKRYLQKYAEAPIAKYIIENNPEAGTTLVLDCNDSGLTLYAE